MKKSVRSLLAICATAAAISAIALAGLGCDDSGINKGLSGKVDAFLSQFSADGTGTPPPDTPATAAKFTVTYNGNTNTSGTVPTDAAQYASGATVVVLDNTGNLAKTGGYTFDGWNAAANGSGASYNAGTTFSIYASTTLFAKWAEANVTPTIHTLTMDVYPTGAGTVLRDPNPPSYNPNQTSYNSGTLVAITATPASGYTFSGWSGASSSTNPFITVTMDGDRTLTANFRWAGYFNPNISYTSFTDARDSTTYKTVKIGNQTWMAENLNYTPTSGNSWCYDNSPDSCTKYGRLYYWGAAMTACPSGWHLPTQNEWGTLITRAGGTNTAGAKLKATSGWSGSGNGTDDDGFSALPGGIRFYLGSFLNAGTSGYWWSATTGCGGACRRSMSSNANSVVESGIESYTDNSLSVRCVKNDD